MKDIDLVITYLNNNDKKWQRDYKTYSKIEKKKYDPFDVRFRDWNNFKYVLRSIANYMSFINNLYIVVSDESQIPEYVNTDTIKIIFHKDIIPEKYLPTFNSNTIELFIYKIPELSENFLYTNDDIFITNNISAKDFYDNEMNPKIDVFEKRITRNNVYINSLRNTQELVLNEHNITFKSNLSLLRSNHSINPMKKSMWEYYWDKYKNEMSNSITRFRDKSNITQELSNYHFFIKDKNNITKRNTRYFSFINSTTYDLENLINDKNITAICINDNGVIDFDIYKTEVNVILERKYPNKCIYEK